jgi:hypothetical protein
LCPLDSFCGEQLLVKALTNITSLTPTRVPTKKRQDEAKLGTTTTIAIAITAATNASTTKSEEKQVERDGAPYKNTLTYNNKKQRTKKPG